MAGMPAGIGQSCTHLQPSTSVYGASGHGARSSGAFTAIQSSSVIVVRAGVGGSLNSISTSCSR